MSPLPHTMVPDSTLELFRDGYQFISKRCQRYHTDAFQTRLMLKPVTCVQGEDAARMFYEPGRFTRRGAIPVSTVTLLQDQGSVAMLDGHAHFERKAMFMSLMTDANIQRLVDLMVETWRGYVPKWQGMERVVLDHQVAEILCRAVCAWSGVPLAEDEVRRRTREFVAMFDGAGAVGPRNWQGHLLRGRTEGWIKRLVERIRAGELKVPEGSAAHVIAWHREPDGNLLDPSEATVEILNILRPTVAVARFITFAALALHEHPECREALQQELQRGDDQGDQYLEAFAQEVRRFSPFFALIGGHALQGFDWHGEHFPVGAWVLLDLYGTNRDARVWDDPEVFRPDRFRHPPDNAFSLIPQGGGDHYANHRCAGEWPTVALLKEAIRLLTIEMRYDVPAQDLHVDLSRMPAVPESRFVITNVRPLPWVRTGPGAAGTPGR